MPDAEADVLERRIETTLWKAPGPDAGSTPRASRTPRSPATDASDADPTLRPGRDASESDLAAARELLVRGWIYVMPRPKSSKAAWGNRDGRTTWWAGHWRNTSTGRTSMERPSAADDFRGDGTEPGWRRGGSPADPTDIQWLCSKSGGPPS